MTLGLLRVRRALGSGALPAFNEHAWEVMR